MTREDVIQQINDERAAQDEQWGGADHDFQHYEADWLSFIRRQMAKAEFGGDAGVIGGADFNERLVKIAALAVAALEVLA